MTLSVAALGLGHAAGQIMEPAIALSVVCVGVDNLLVGDGRRERDLRPWMAGCSGSFTASVSRRCCVSSACRGKRSGWSLFSFNLGVEIGQLGFVLPSRQRWPRSAARIGARRRRLAMAGSGLSRWPARYWFVQRVFFPGGEPEPRSA